MTARMKRITSDFEQIKKDFYGHKNIIVTPVGSEPPEQYNVTYFVNGIYLLPDGRIQTLNRHEVEITLHAEYPRYKPICKIKTPIWHPNFKDGQICIGDIWGAGESLSDIIVNIGDMIQYKSWNSYSPLSAEAAKWAMEHKQIFPVGTLDLYKADFTDSKSTKVEIDLLNTNDEKESVDDSQRPHNAINAEQSSNEATAPPIPIFDGALNTAVAIDTMTNINLPAGAGASFINDLQNKNVVESEKTESLYNNQDRTIGAGIQSTQDGNDFDITADELAGIEFVPTAQRMQSLSHGGVVQGGKINFKTILMKGLIWAFVGAILGFAISEISGISSGNIVLRWMGYSNVANVFDKIQHYYSGDEYDYTTELEIDKMYNDLDMSDDEISGIISSSMRITTALFSAIIALGLATLLGIGEGVFYGSAEKAIKYALLGAGISLVIGAVSGYIAQIIYTFLLGDTGEIGLFAAFARGFVWAIMGGAVGLAVGLIKPEMKRIIFCVLGGLGGGFIGGFIFNYLFDIFSSTEGDTGTLPRAIGILVMGLLVGLGIGLLEQFAKSAWLKVIRGEFEGKEYLVFSGTTSIGNNGKNTIVLFKDKLVGPNHCDIVLEGNKYVLIDKGTPMGTVVNGRRIQKHILKQGDAIAVGNSVLVFNTK